MEARGGVERGGGCSWQALQRETVPRGKLPESEWWKGKGCVYTSKLRRSLTSICTCGRMLSSTEDGGSSGEGKGGEWRRREGKEEGGGECVGRGWGRSINNHQAL